MLSIFSACYASFFDLELVSMGSSSAILYVLGLTSNQVFDGGFCSPWLPRKIYTVLMKFISIENALIPNFYY